MSVYGEVKTTYILLGLRRETFYKYIASDNLRKNINVFQLEAKK